MLINLWINMLITFKRKMYRLTRHKNIHVFLNTSSTLQFDTSIVLINLLHLIMLMFMKLSTYLQLALVLLRQSCRPIQCRGCGGRCHPLSPQTMASLVSPLCHTINIIRGQKRISPAVDNMMTLMLYMLLW